MKTLVHYKQKREFWHFASHKSCYEAGFFNILSPVKKTPPANLIPLHFLNRISKATPLTLVTWNGVPVEGIVRPPADVQPHIEPSHKPRTLAGGQILCQMQFLA